MSALEELIALSESDDLMWAADRVDLPNLQLAAANERFQEQRKRIRILDQRATDMGVDEIKSFDDAVPLLFSHTTYKSYPASFVTNGQWDRLLAWFATVSSYPMDDVDLTGVQSVDDWAQRVTDAGHYVFSSGGTSGKSSFIDQSKDDLETLRRMHRWTWGWPKSPPADNSRPLIALVPSAGPNKIIYLYKTLAHYFARPDAIYTLTDEPIRMSEINNIMKIQEAMAAGRASPSEVAEFEANLGKKANQMEANYKVIAGAVDLHRNEPFILFGTWPQVWSLMEACRDAGVRPGGFHPDTIFFGGGGTKGLALPDDYQEQIVSFFDGARLHQTYGMSEVSNNSPRCEAGRFHSPPSVSLMILDETAEKRIYRPEGTVTGRAAFLDPAWDGHWGGIISGDWISADYARCACGRPGPTVENSVRRAKDIIGIEDDKISCAGAIEAYIRGAIVTSVDRTE